MIEAPYLLVLNIALHEEGGRLWAEPLWHKDLMLHLDEIADLSLFCPVVAAPPPPGWLPVEHPRLKVVAGPPMGRFAAFRLPAIIKALRRAIIPAGIVHAGIAGWPFPLGWIAIPIARRLGKLTIVVVESSFWRAAPGDGTGKQAKARMFEGINRWCLKQADLLFFTAAGYRDSLVGADRADTHIMPASWVDAGQMLSGSDAAQIWDAKADRLLFAGRLTETKGVATLLAALEHVQARVDLIGEGPLEAAVRAMAARFPDRIRLLASVPYGPEFFALLDRYPALIVPTLTDEQPRIIIDAFARAVPVIASDTPGNAGLAVEGETARLVPAGDATALARAIDATSRDDLRRMGLTALARTRRMTHQAMHADRAAIIADTHERRRDRRAA